MIIIIILRHPLSLPNGKNHREAPHILKAFQKTQKVYHKGIYFPSPEVQFTSTHCQKHPACKIPLSLQLKYSIYIGRN